MDSDQRRKNGLNLTTGMSEKSQCLEIVSGSFSQNSSLSSPSIRAIASLSSPSKGSTCSDRFIPCKSSSRLYTFGLIEKSSPAKERGNDTYSRLLKQELFGYDVGSFSLACQGSPLSSSKNMFWFKMDHSAPNSPYSPSILGSDNGFSCDTSTPPKPQRKVPKTPYMDLVSM